MVEIITKKKKNFIHIASIFTSFKICLYIEFFYHQKKQVTRELTLSILLNKIIFK